MTVLDFPWLHTTDYGTWCWRRKWGWSRIVSFRTGSVPTTGRLWLRVDLSLMKELLQNKWSSTLPPLSKWCSKESSSNRIIVALKYWSKYCFQSFKAGHIILYFIIIRETASEVQFQLFSQSQVEPRKMYKELVIQTPLVFTQLLPNQIWQSKQRN